MLVRSTTTEGRRNAVAGWGVALLGGASAWATLIAAIRLL